MGLVDIVLMVVIVGTSGYYLYYSLFKKKGCSGCSSEGSASCSKNGDYKNYP